MLVPRGKREDLRHRCVLAIGCACALAGLAAAFAIRWGRPELEPRAEPAAVTEQAPHTDQLAPSAPRALLPAGTVVLHVKNAASVRTPFVLRKDPTAVDGVVLAAPEAGGSRPRKGRAELSVDVPCAGRYHAWVRARWRDECGNSVSLKLGGSPARIAGNDSVYEAWHWVEAGRHALKRGRCPLVLLEREDGIAVDQILLTRDAAFRPTGPVMAGLIGAGVERFGDGFDRSPGHGLGRWEVVSGRWQIAFSFDPNRIPNQYSLAAEAAGGEALALIESRTWHGCRLAFSALPTGAGRFGCVVERAGGRELRVAVQVTARGAALSVTGDGAERKADLGQRVRPNQWHRIAVERWAWMLRVFVDGDQVLEGSDLEPRAGRLGLLVGEGAVVFDDVSAEEVPWLADDGRHRRIAWRPSEDAQWYRRRSDGALVGRVGILTSPDVGLPVRDWAPDSEGFFASGGRGAGNVVRLAALAGEEVRLRRVAVAYGRARPDRFRIGPYHFTEPRIEDPSDYLHFTPEEWRAIQRSPDADKLRRRAKYIPLVGGGTHCIWSRRTGAWRVRDGVLVGRGPDAALQYTQEIISDLELRAKVRLPRGGSTARVVLYSNGAAGARVHIGGEGATGQGGVHLAAPGDGEWHALRVRVTGAELEAQLGPGEARRATISRRDAGRVLLEAVTGLVEFDDIEFNIPRRAGRGAFHTFDRRETDWWRTGARWVDHGGMSCVLASHWVSLIAPDGEGMLWHKRTFGPDALLAFNLEENSEWFGWSQNPSHVHHPYDNIRAVLAPAADLRRGYRLEVNARDRTVTVLYRDGKEVASVAQDERSPMRYVGGHAPYRPRKNRVTFSKRGAVLKATVNGAEVLRWVDPHPIAVQKVGLGGYRTRANFSHIEIRAFGRAARAGG